MYSYPNNIPLSAREINTLHAAVKPLAYDAMYGAFGKYIKTGAHEALDFSLERYLQRIQ